MHPRGLRCSFFKYDPIFSVVAPCPRGASPPSVLAVTFTKGCWRMLAALAIAEFLGMTLWFSATAVTPVLADELGISPAQVPWLTMAVQAGFVVGTLGSAAANLA